MNKVLGITTIISIVDPGASYGVTRISAGQDCEWMKIRQFVVGGTCYFSGTSIGPGGATVTPVTMPFLQPTDARWLHFDGNVNIWLKPMGTTCIVYTMKGLNQI